MGRMPPSILSAPGSAARHLAELVPRPTSIPQQTVLLWDPRRSRLELTRQVVSACGAQPRDLEGVSALSRFECFRGGNIAVVALGACTSSGNLVLEGIRSLKRKGFRVICYDDGAHSWPLNRRCQALLAGASRLLDSAKAEFSQELRRLLEEALQAEAGKWNEEDSVRRVMKKLGSVGESQAIIAVFQTVRRISTLSDVPMLITGETGTGKELLAHAIHQLDLKRRRGPFVALNCSAISPGLAESELFGHRRGAFTGADRDRKGLFRAAEGGVLFLDEIGELDDALQAKLLRVLQERCVLGVGEDREVSIDVRIIAATNRDLNVMIQQRQFRADLFHRLNVLPIHIPPLRERPADLKPLIEHFLEKYRSLRPARSLSVGSDFIDALRQLQLPGNARELENLARWVLVNKDDDAPLNLGDLPLEIWRQLSERGQPHQDQLKSVDEGDDVQRSAPEASRQDTSAFVVSLLDTNGWSLSRSLQYCERLILEAALGKAQGNQSQIARLLGITPRSVYNKIRRHQLHR